MVRFANQHNAANNNAAKENANTNNNNKTGSGKASSKKRLPVTPHPSKKQHSRGGSGGDRNLPSEASTNACVSLINSVSQHNIDGWLFPETDRNSGMLTLRFLL
jgi:hypothetical protein